MGRHYWNVQKKVGGVWTADGQIARPNDNTRIPTVSTQTKVQLADGDNAFVTPNTKYRRDPINWIWYADKDGTIKTKIEGYIENRNDVKITDDLGNDFIGRFISIEPVRRVGTADEKYDIVAVFERMPSLE